MDEETADSDFKLNETRTVAVNKRRKVIQEKEKVEKAAPSTKPKEKEEKAEKAAPSTKPKEKEEKAEKAAPSTKPKEKEEKAEKAAPSTKPKEKEEKAEKAAPSKKEKADKATSSTKPKEKEKADKAVPSTKPKEKGKATASTESKKKTIFDLVCEAVEASGETKKGISAQAIRKYVKSHHNSEAPSLDGLINKAINKGIETEKLERPPASKNAKGATGCFRLPKTLASKRTNIKTAKRRAPDEYVSDSEATEKPEKPRKRTFSDTYIEEMRASATSTPKSSVKRTMPLKAPPKKTANIKKEPAKKAKIDKPKMEKADSTSKIQNNVKGKKLFDGGKENEAKTKSGKAKAKK